jgi:hypothetical protein
MPRNTAPGVLIVELTSSLAVRRSAVGVLFVAREVDEIAAHRELSAIDLILLWPEIADNAAVCGAFVFGDLRFANEKTGVCARYVAYPLKQSSQFVCKAVFLHLSVFVQLMR